MSIKSCPEISLTAFFLFKDTLVSNTYITFLFDNKA